MDSPFETDDPFETTAPESVDSTDPAESPSARRRRRRPASSATQGAARRQEQDTRSEELLARYERRLQYFREDGTLDEGPHEPEAPPTESERAVRLGQEAIAEAARAAAARAADRARTEQDAWNAAQDRARGWMAEAGKRFTRAIKALPDGSDRVMNGLAPLALFADKKYGNPNPQTVLGVALTVQADQKDPKVLDPTTCIIARQSTLHTVLDQLEDLKDWWTVEPYDQFQVFLADPDGPVLWAALITCLGGPAAVRNTWGADHEMSAANFDVEIRPASGRPLADVFAELDQYTGMQSVKEVLQSLAATARIDAERDALGLPRTAQARHMLFLGKPGTGKTTVARLVADVLAASGAMPDAHLVEADRAMLVAEFIGATAQKTHKVIDTALGGVLFIDEAYSLAGSGDYSADRFAKEALDILVKAMEDERDDLVVILAGYPEPMEQLLAMNPGLASRIGLTVDFPDYTTPELIDIFAAMAADRGYGLADLAEQPIHDAIAAADRGPDFGNARLARTLLDASIRAQALRLAAGFPQGQPIPRDELVALRFADTLSARAATTRPTPPTD